MLPLILLFSAKGLIKIPLGLRVQHRIFTAKESLEKRHEASTALRHGRGASRAERGFQHTSCCAASGHLKPEARAWEPRARRIKWLWPLRKKSIFS